MAIFSALVLLYLAAAMLGKERRLPNCLAPMIADEAAQQSRPDSSVDAHLRRCPSRQARTLLNI